MSISLVTFHCAVAEELQKQGDITMEHYQLEPAIHHYLGIDLNMQVWNLLGKADRAQHDNNRMIAFAKSSLFHWHHSPNFQPVNAQRGEWLLARVYTVLNRPEQALEHAEKCLQLTEKHKFVDFDLAYEYEAMARAFAANDNADEYKRYLKLAQQAGEKIEDKESM